MSAAERLMLVTGAPGTGKSAVIAQLAGEEPCGEVLGISLLPKREQQYA